MATPSSPTSSSRSAFSSSFPAASSSRFSALPVAALREKIVEKVLENRVTLIVGDTGCGKSSQVPQYLLEANLKPILCTQPRRFAVVAVAKTVAKSRKCEIGGEVGYHIGHSKNLSESSKLVFKTAGVLVEEMRDKGSNALNYKVIILDEVHERSIESDLVLVCVKQYLMKNKDLRVVLMSATADTLRYKDYFKDLGRDERVEVLAIPTLNQKAVFDRKVLYLEQINDIIGSSANLSSSTLGSSDSTSFTPNVDIKPEVHKLIHDLVLHIHDNEPDIEKSILVFLPTYYSLEQQWYLLMPLSSAFKVHILHGSVDTNEALNAMKIWKSHRKVILATNIAESSVTIPKVAYVIDSCRSLQVSWDKNRRKESAKLVWVSKSQAEQRRGRTGRTCDGKVYRLVTGSFFSKLDDYELPAILRLSLRQQVLQICCSESKAINDPKVLLQRTLDPPNLEVVEEALNLLVHMNVLEKISPRGRYEPTFFGRLLASFSLSFDASVLVLKFGAIGMLREGILLGVLMDSQPLPILRPFGDGCLGTDYTDCYFREDISDTKLTGRKEISLMGNLCAFQFWQRAFKDKQRVKHLRKLLVSDEIQVSTLLQNKVEEEWCSFHYLVQPSLNSVSDTYEDVLNSIHRFRPNFLAIYDGLPLCYDTNEFEHTCLLERDPKGIDALKVSDNQNEPFYEEKICSTVPFVESYEFGKPFVANNFAAIIKEIKSQLTEEVYDNQYGNDFSPANEGVPLCIYFQKGTCTRGSQCPFSHSLQANKPTCKFFLSLKGCRNGASCSFFHDTGPPAQISSSASPAICLPEGDYADTTSLLGLLPLNPNGRVLVLDDTELCFSTNLSRFFDPSKILATSSQSSTSIFDPSLDGVEIFWGLRHLYQTIISTGGKSIPWEEIECVLWFPNFEGAEEQIETQRMLVRNFFEYLAIRMLADSLGKAPVILTMNNIRFSQLQVEKLGRESFFFLTGSFPHAESSFGKLRDTVSTKKPMVVSRPISYVFNLNPPSRVQFGDLSARFKRVLNEIQ